MASALAVLAVTEGARAVEPPTGVVEVRSVRLAVDAPCTNPTDFAERLARRTRRIASVNDDESADRVVVRIAASGGVTVGTFEVARGRGPTRLRKVEAATCDEVADMLSLAVALTYDPNALVVPSSRSLAPTPVAPPGSSDPKPETPPAVASSPAPASAVHTPAPVPASANATGPAWGVRLGGHFVVGVTPDAIPVGGQLFADLARRAGPSVRFGVEARRAETELGAVSVTLVWVVAQPLVCPVHLRADWFDVAPCAGVAIGAVSASSEGATRPQSSVRMALAPSIGLLASAAVSERLSLEARAGIEAPLLRADFKIGAVVAYEDPSVAPVFGLGLTYALAPSSRRVP